MFNPKVLKVTSCKGCQSCIELTNKGWIKLQHILNINPYKEIK